MSETKNIDIRVIPSTVKGSRFVAAEWEKHIQVWDMQTGLVNKVESEFDWGGNSGRIAIFEDGIHIAVGAYEKNTIALYNAETGQCVWQRKGLRRPLTVSVLNRVQPAVCVHTEDSGSILLDKKTGETIGRIRGVELVHENPYGAISVFGKRSSLLLVNGIDEKPIKKFFRKCFSMLDICFSNDEVFCAYACNPLEAISLVSLMSIWEINVEGHFLDIEYCIELDTLLGVRWDYNKGGPSYLCYINAKTGKIEKEVNVGENVITAFLCQGKFVVTNHGDVYSTISGQKVKQFDFENQKLC